MDKNGFKPYYRLTPILHVMKIMHKKLLLQLLVLLTVSACDQPISESIEEDKPDSTASLQMVDPKEVYLLGQKPITDEDVTYITNYECNWDYSEKIDKLYSFGHMSHVFFSRYSDRSSYTLFAHFLTESPCQEGKYDLYSYPLRGHDSLVSVFRFTDDYIKDEQSDYWVCLTMTLNGTDQKNNSFYVDMFTEECGNHACYMEIATPPEQAFEFKMRGVRKYEDFITAWKEYRSFSSEEK